MACGFAMNLLLGVATAELPPHATVVANMTAAAVHYIDHLDHHTRDDCGWQHAAFLKGVLAVSRADGVSLGVTAKLTSYVQSWGDARGWICCNIDKVLTEHAGANDMSCGSSFAEVWMAHSTKAANDTYVQNVRDDVLDVVVKRSAIDDWWWVDAYFMAMGTFARMGTIVGGSEGATYHDKGFALYNDSAMRRGLWSAKAGLYFRDETYFNKTTPHGEHVFWGRGNGWAAGALARVLEFTPKTHAAHPIYVSHLQAMAKTAARIQDPHDGMWRASLLDPASFPNPESTGSSGLLFGLAFGVNHGYLDHATYAPVVEKAWRGMSTINLHADGFLGFCQPVGGGPANANASDTSDFCVGLFLLAASEVAAMAK